MATGLAQVQWPFDALDYAASQLGDKSAVDHSYFLMTMCHCSKIYVSQLSQMGPVSPLVGGL